MESLWNTAAKGFGALGLNTPSSRFGAVFLASAGAEYLIQPGYAYDSQGFRPPFFLDPNGTYVPALVVPFLLGATFSLFL